MLALVGGCRAATPVDSQIAAEEARTTIEVGAIRELASKEAREPIAAPIPPGVDPARLSARGDRDVRAQMSARQAVDFMVTTSPPRVERDEKPRGEQPSSFEDRLQAQHHYAAGVAATIEGRHFIANQEFQKAYDLDPTDTGLVRKLARSYAAIRNNLRAVAAYQDLLRLAPGDAEASLAIGLDAARQGRFEEAVVTLGPVIFAKGFDHDPGADIIAEYTLGLALRQLGFDRAEVEMSGRTVARLDDFNALSGYANEIESIRRRMADVWLAAGDARARLGEYEESLRAYDRARTAGGVDRSALLPREIYINLRLARRFEAQRLFLAAVTDEAPAIDDRLLRLAAYLRDQLGETGELARALGAIHHDHPDDATIARLIASLLSDDEGIALLTDFAARHPGDRGVIAQLVDWLSAERIENAVRLVHSLIRQNPQEAIEYSDLLFDRIGLSREAVEWLDSIRDPAAGLIASRLFLRAEGVAEAWRRAQSGAAGSPFVRQQLLNRLDIAAALREPDLVRAVAVELGEARSADEWTQTARAWRLVEEHDPAADAARLAVAVDPEFAEAWIELALALATDRARIAEAIDATERALEIEPSNEEALELLVRIFSEDGPAPDRARLEQVWRRINEHAPQSRLRALIIADQYIASRQWQEAVGELLPWYENDESDAESLTRIVSCWLGSGDQEQAEAWVRLQRESRPDDPALLRELVRILIQREQADEAEQLLRDRLAAWANDAPAASALEVVLRARGAIAEAAALGEARITARPSGTRRSIDLAALYADSERTAEALAQLEPVVAQFATLPQNLAQRVIAVAGQLPENEREADILRAQSIEAYLERWPDAPLQIYGAGLLALARLDRAGSEIDAFITRMIESASDQSGGAQREVAIYRDLAQALIGVKRPEIAAKVALMRLRSDRALMREGRALLAQVAQAASVLARDIDGARAVIDQLEAQGELWILPMPADTENRRAEALYSLSVFCTLAGLESEADALLLDALALDSDHAMALNNLGYRRVELNRNDDATIHFVERAIELEPENANILDTVAWLRYKQGRFSKPDSPDPGALELIDRAIARLTTDGEEINPEVLDHRGDILWRTGRHGPAVEAWTEALRMAESNTYRADTINSYLRYQQLGWGLLAVSPEEIYARIHQKILETTRDKIESARTGEAPAVSPTFAEVRVSDHRDAREARDTLGED